MDNQEEIKIILNFNMVRHNELLERLGSLDILPKHSVIIMLVHPFISWHDRYSLPIPNNGQRHFDRVERGKKHDFLSATI